LSEIGGVFVVSSGVTVRRASLGVGLALGISLLVLAVRSVDPLALRRHLSSADLFWVGVGLLMVVGTMVAKALRWRLLFYPAHEDLRLRNLISALLIGQTINLLLPARLGELARAYVVGRREAPPAMLALGTIVVEKTLDGLALLLLLGILFVAMPFPPWLRVSGAAAALVIAVLLATVLLLTGGRQRIVGCSERLCQIVPTLERLGLRRRLESLADGLRSLQKSGVEVRLLVWTGAIWLLGALTNYLILRSLQIETSLVLASLFVLAVVHLGLVVPTSPARIGVFHFLCLLALSFVGVEESQALAFGFVLHFIVVGPVILGGLLCLWKENLTLYRLAREVDGS
jgi:uncharacterized protein (TIRG00374 family)